MEKENILKTNITTEESEIKKNQLFYLQFMLYYWSIPQFRKIP